MPQQKGPIKERPRVEDESTGRGREKHGVHRQRDEALPGRGGDRAGLNRESGVADAGKDKAAPTRGVKQNRG